VHRSSGATRAALRAASKRRAQRLELRERRLLRLRVVDHDQLPQLGSGPQDRPGLVREAPLGDEHARPSVVDRLEELVDRRRVVQRERHGPDQQRAHVDDVELQPGGQQQRHTVAMADTQRLEAAGDGGGAPAPLRVAEARLGAVIPEGHLVGLRLGYLEEGRAQRRRRHRRMRGIALGHGGD
jgi:hypothetical protein